MLQADKNVKNTNRTTTKNSNIKQLHIYVYIRKRTDHMINHLNRLN